MQKQLQQVAFFHKAMNQPVLQTPQIPSDERVNLRIALIFEEAQEFANAAQQENLTEAADALSDLLYVLLGTVHELGLGEAFEACFDEVQRSNMSKLGPDGKPIYRHDGKVLKGSEFTPPDIAGVIKHYQEKHK